LRRSFERAAFHCAVTLGVFPSLIGWFHLSTVSSCSGMSAASSGIRRLRENDSQCGFSDALDGCIRPGFQRHSQVFRSRLEIS
jgi:hypothetical protein